MRRRADAAGRDDWIMFDVDALIDDCRDRTGRAPSPRRAVRQVVERAVATPGPIGDALQPTEGGITMLHEADDLTVLHVVWVLKMSIYSDDHGMWAAIGIYAGQEDNAFSLLPSAGSADWLTDSGGKELRPGDTVLLGDDTIHAVDEPVRPD